MQIVACVATFIAGKLEEHQSKGWGHSTLLRVFDRIDRRQTGRPLDLLKTHTQVRSRHPCRADICRHRA